MLVDLNFKVLFEYLNNQRELPSEQVIPKNPSLQTQMKVSTLTSTQVAPLLHGELSRAVQFPENSSKIQKCDS